ncbi:ArsR/SmtB family transcription factor [Tahibacter amnicola]|uniref:ArsR family transcriptional regulator n=1 Tax=Tahibacter amnicola TaxID=2976241 RepID=A0ABY6BKL3_9GAMM|nr:helix-turn-helix transcriptional regulator [Tahibacter amnicola]UXI70551.1 ArsR family transcriptional regulator [Tahibacter amnicola]
MTTSRAAPTIARQFTQTLDTAFFRALCEPARVELLAALIAKGPTDINALADAVPQDRSVVSRHLKVLEDAGILHSVKEGRHRIYRIQGDYVVAYLEKLLAQVRAMVKQCC